MEKYWWERTRKEIKRDRKDLIQNQIRNQKLKFSDGKFGGVTI